MDAERKRMTGLSRLPRRVAAWPAGAALVLLAVLGLAACGGGERAGRSSGASVAEGGAGGAGAAGGAASQRLPRRYNCRRDTALMLAPPVEAADTAGLGAKVAAAFPGWRLSTLREMACRFPATDGSRPEDFWGDGWDSGHAWWVWSGDFDGDGAEDKALVLTDAADPSRDELGVLFANGTSAVLGPLGGWMVELRRAGTLVQDVNPAATPIQLRVDAIVIDSGEKTADLFYWTGGGFSSITVPE